MTSSQRKSKQVIIASLYTSILAIVVFIIVINIFPNTPKIIVEQPNIQKLNVNKFGSIELGNGYSDFWAEISNPNDDFGSSKLGYTFVLKNSKEEIVRKSGTTFILPGDKKRYVLLLNISSEYKIENFELYDNLEWSKLSKFNLPELAIRNVELGSSKKAGNAFTAFGILTNNSSVNLKNIQIIAILTDNNKEIIGVNETLIRDVLTAESRDFEMIWQNQINNAFATNTTIYAQSNILTDKELLLQLQTNPIFDN